MRRLFGRGILIVATLGTVCCPAAGEVIDIAPDGTTTVYGAPASIHNDDVRGIAVAHPIPAYSGIARRFPSGAVSAMISDAAARYAINATLLQSVAWQESRFRNDAVSPKGAVGVMQLMPQTALELGVNRYDSSQNILGGAAYLRKMLDRYNGDQALALAAYNAGPGAVDRYRSIPPYLETQNYIKSMSSGLVPSVQFSSPSVIFIDP